MKLRSTRSADGFSLVEVAIAMGIAAFCLVSILGLLPIGMNSNRISFEQTTAANLASSVVADLRTASATAAGGNPISPMYGLPVPSTPTAGRHTLFLREDGTLAGQVDQDATAPTSPRYRVTLYYTPAGTVGGTVGNPNATNVRVLITWPALPDSTAASDPSRFSGSFETFTGFVGR